MPEYTLFTETCNRLTRTLTYDTFRDLLHKAKDKRRIDSQASEDCLRWGITPDGLFRLRQMPLTHRVSMTPKPVGPYCKLKSLQPEQVEQVGIVDVGRKTNLPRSRPCA